MLKTGPTSTMEKLVMLVQEKRKGILVIKIYTVTKFFQLNQFKLQRGIENIFLIENSRREYI